MTPDEWDKVSEIFHAAAEMNAEERKAFLDQACGRDDSLRAEVDSLLAAHHDAGSFISEPAISFSEPPPAPTLSGSDLGHFRIEWSIGKGGMGEVYLATDRRLDRKVALKKLPDRLASDPKFLKRFHVEARAAAILNHPNVAIVYSVEVFDGRPFITMEYVDGQTLESTLPAAGMELKEFVDLFATLADALAHAHERGITHRDIKPGNIMISNTGVPKILDFGLAQISAGTRSGDDGESKITLSNQVIGTPSYMSPEQARGEEVDQRSDIFSFGVLMYEAITGVRPFHGDSHAEIVSNLLKQEPEKISSLRPGLPNSISKLISKCIRKRMSERCQSMEEVRAVLQELNAALQTGPTSSGSLSRFYHEAQTSSFLWFGVSTAAVLVLAFSGWLYFSQAETESPFDLQNLVIRRLSQTENMVFAQITPDGTSVVFSAIEDDARRSLWIRGIDDHNSLQLLAPQPVQFWGGLAVNKESSQIYYITAERDARHGTMYRISSFGGLPRKLVEKVNDVGSMSADGKRILFVRYGDRNEIRTADAETGGGEVLITDAESRRIFRDPQFSVDGKSIFYIIVDRTELSDRWSLVKREISTGSESVIVEPQSFRMSEIAVLPSGALLLNATDPVSMLPQLFHVALPGGVRTRITNDLYSYFGISVDSRGEKIVAAQRQDAKNIWVGEASDPNSSREMPTGGRVNLKVEWAPDGRIVYDALDNGVPHIWISNPDGTERRQLTSNDSRDLEAVVSPAGRHIVFTSDRTGENKIWRMELDGSGQTLLTPVDGVADGPRFAADGQTVLFNWKRSSGSRVIGSVNISGGNIGEMSLFGESYWAISPDGSRVAYVFRNEEENKSQVAIRQINTASPEKILDVSPTNIFQWARDGKSLLYRERQAGEIPHATVLKRNIDAAETEIFFSKGPESVTHIAFSSDGRRIAMIRGQLFTDAVLIRPQSRP